MECVHSDVDGGERVVVDDKFVEEELRSVEVH